MDCDRCPAEAFVKVEFAAADLWFCGHHYDASTPKLLALLDEGVVTNITVGERPWARTTITQAPAIHRVKVIKTLDDGSWIGHAVLVQHGEHYYVISTNGQETMIFRSNPDGLVTNWSEVAGAPA